MHKANWLPIGTANKGKIHLWDGLDKHHNTVYAFTHMASKEPEGNAGYRSLKSLLSLNKFHLDEKEGLYGSRKRNG